MTSISSTVPSETSYGQIVSTGAVVENTVAVSINDTEQIVRSYFEDIPVMVQVARCESTFRHTLADGSVLKGVVDLADTGAMQLDLEDIYDNMAYARHLYETQGTQPWSASAPCWNQSLAMNI